jgi:hypothetical protein
MALVTACSESKYAAVHGRANAAQGNRKKQQELAKGIH